MHWEVEQKFWIEGLNLELEKTLREMGLTLSAAERQIDRYFNHPGRDFAATDEALRLRSVGEQNFLTYKGPKIDPNTKTRREIELSLANGAAVALQFAEVLTALGFRPSGTVIKSRRKGDLDWEDQRVELALDWVEGLGAYLEVEITADDEGLSAAQAAVKSLAVRLGLTRVERRSYLELLLAKNT